MSTKVTLYGSIFLGIFNVLFLGMYGLGISFIGQDLNAWICILGGFIGLVLLGIVFHRRYKKIVGFFGLLVLFIGINTCFLFIVHSEAISLGISVVICLGAYFLFEGKVLSKGQIFLVIFSIVPILLMIRGILFLSTNYNFFHYVDQNPYRKCIESECVSVYYMQTGFFFGDNYYLATKQYYFPFLEKDIHLGHLPRNKNFKFDLILNGKEYQLLIRDSEGKLIREILVPY